MNQEYCLFHFSVIFPFRIVTSNAYAWLEMQEARKDPLWQTYITEGIKRTNAKAVSNAQKIQKFAIIDEDFSDKNGDLTPTLKLKRAVVVNKYADVIDALYQ